MYSVSIKSSKLARHQGDVDSAQQSKATVAAKTIPRLSAKYVNADCLKSRSSLEKKNGGGVEEKKGSDKERDDDSYGSDDDFVKETPAAAPLSDRLESALDVFRISRSSVSKSKEGKPAIKSSAVKSGSDTEPSKPLAVQPSIGSAFRPVKQTTTISKTKKPVSLEKDKQQQSARERQMAYDEQVRRRNWRPPAVNPSPKLSAPEVETVTTTDIPKELFFAKDFGFPEELELDLPPRRMRVTSEDPLPLHQETAPRPQQQQQQQQQQFQQPSRAPLTVNYVPARRVSRPAQQQLAPPKLLDRPFDKSQEKRQSLSRKPSSSINSHDNNRSSKTALKPKTSKKRSTSTTTSAGLKTKKSNKTTKAASKKPVPSTSNAPATARDRYRNQANYEMDEPGYGLEYKDDLLEGYFDDENTEEDEETEDEDASAGEIVESDQEDPLTLQQQQEQPTNKKKIVARDELVEIPEIRLSISERLHSYLHNSSRDSSMLSSHNNLALTASLDDTNTNKALRNYTMNPLAKLALEQSLVYGTASQDLQSDANEPVTAPVSAPTTRAKAPIVARKQEPEPEPEPVFAQEKASFEDQNIDERALLDRLRPLHQHAHYSPYESDEESTGSLFREDHVRGDPTYGVVQTVLKKQQQAAIAAQEMQKKQQRQLQLEEQRRQQQQQKAQDPSRYHKSRRSRSELSAAEVEGEDAYSYCIEADSKEMEEERDTQRIDIEALKEQIKREIAEERAETKRLLHETSFDHFPIRPAAPPISSSATQSQPQRLDPKALRLQMMEELQRQDELFQYTLELQDLQAEATQQQFPAPILLQTQQPSRHATRDSEAQLQLQQMQLQLEHGTKAQQLQQQRQQDDELLSTERTIAESEQLLHLYTTLQRQQSTFAQAQVQAQHAATLHNLQTLPLLAQIQQQIDTLQQQPPLPLPQHLQPHLQPHFQPQHPSQQTKVLRETSTLTPASPLRTSRSLHRYPPEETDRHYHEMDTQTSPQKPRSTTASTGARRRPQSHPTYPFYPSTPFEEAVFLRRKHTNDRGSHRPLRSAEDERHGDLDEGPVDMDEDHVDDEWEEGDALLQLQHLEQRQKERMAWLDHVIRLHLSTPAEAVQERRRIEAVHVLELEGLRQEVQAMRQSRTRSDRQSAPSSARSSLQLQPQLQPPHQSTESVRPSRYHEEEREEVDEEAESDVYDDRGSAFLHISSPPQPPLQRQSLPRSLEHATEGPFNEAQLNFNDRTTATTLPRRGGVEEVREAEDEVVFEAEAEDKDTSAEHSHYYSLSPEEEDEVEVEADADEGEDEVEQESVNKVEDEVAEDEEEEEDEEEYEEDYEAITASRSHVFTAPQHLQQQQAHREQPSNKDVSVSHVEEYSDFIVEADDDDHEDEDHGVLEEVQIKEEEESDYEVEDEAVDGGGLQSTQVEGEVEDEVADEIEDEVEEEDEVEDDFEEVESVGFARSRHLQQSAAEDAEDATYAYDDDFVTSHSLSHLLLPPSATTLQPPLQPALQPQHEYSAEDFEVEDEVEDEVEEEVEDEAVAVEEEEDDEDNDLKDDAEDDRAYETQTIGYEDTFEATQVEKEEVLQEAEDEEVDYVDEFDSQIEPRVDDQEQSKVASVLENEEAESAMEYTADFHSSHFNSTLGHFTAVVETQDHGDDKAEEDVQAVAEAHLSSASIAQVDEDSAVDLAEEEGEEDEEEDDAYDDEDFERTHSAAHLLVPAASTLPTTLPTAVASEEVDREVRREAEDEEVDEEVDEDIESVDEDEEEEDQEDEGLRGQPQSQESEDAEEGQRVVRDHEEDEDVYADDVDAFEEQEADEDEDDEDAKEEDRRDEGVQRDEGVREEVQKVENEVENKAEDEEEVCEEDYDDEFDASSSSSSASAPPQTPPRSLSADKEVEQSQVQPKAEVKAVVVAEEEKEAEEVESEVEEVLEDEEEEEDYMAGFEDEDEPTPSAARQPVDVEEGNKDFSTHDLNTSTSMLSQAQQPPSQQQDQSNISALSVSLNTSSPHLQLQHPSSNLHADSKSADHAPENDNDNNKNNTSALSRTSLHTSSFSLGPGHKGSSVAAEEDDEVYDDDYYALDVAADDEDDILSEATLRQRLLRVSTRSIDSLAPPHTPPPPSSLHASNAAANATNQIDSLKGASSSDDLQGQAGQGSATAPVHFDYEQQKWVGGEEVSLAGFESSSSQDANERLPPSNSANNKKTDDITPSHTAEEALEVEDEEVAEEIVDEEAEAEDDALDVESSVESGYLAQRETLYFPVVFLAPPTHTDGNNTKKTTQKKTEDADDFLDAILGELDDLDDDDDDDDDDDKHVVAAKEESKGEESAVDPSREEVEVAEDEEAFEVEEAVSMSGFAAVEESTYLPTDHHASALTPPERREEEVDEVVDVLLRDLVRDALVRAHDVFHLKRPLESQFQSPSDHPHRPDQDETPRAGYEHKSQEAEENEEDEVEDEVEEEIDEQVEEKVEVAEDKPAEDEEAQNLSAQDTSLYNPVDEDEDEDEEPVVVATSPHPQHPSHSNAPQNHSTSSANTSALQKLRADATPFERAQIMIQEALDVLDFDVLLARLLDPHHPITEPFCELLPVTLPTATTNLPHLSASSILLQDTSFNTSFNTSQPNISMNQSQTHSQLQESLLSTSGLHHPAGAGGTGSGWTLKWYHTVYHDRIDALLRAYHAYLHPSASSTQSIDAGSVCYREDIALEVRLLPRTASALAGFLRHRLEAEAAVASSSSTTATTTAAENNAATNANANVNAYQQQRRRWDVLDHRLVQEVQARAEETLQRDVDTATERILQRYLREAVREVDAALQAKHTR